ncbi:MAG: hypothetical protein ABEJ68_00900 [Halobacteriaceae archaeon]
MSRALGGALGRLKDPAYTGPNRCLPCTAVNLVIALALGAAVAVWWLPAGAGVLAISALAIYFRGYLVPGTPTLTKRYLPRRVLSWFGKAPAEGPAETDADVDVGRHLLSAGLLRDGGDDLYLTDAARDQWWGRIETIRDRDVEPEDVARVLTEDVDLDLQSHGSAWVATANGRPVGRWESRAALLADVAGAELLADHLPAWETANPAVRGEFLGGLRLFLERCPSCDGTVSLGTETVESCCAEREVVAVTCDDCGARLLETDAP